MSRNRRQWGTSFSQGSGEKLRHGSYATVVRYLEHQAANWRSGLLTSPNINIYVDYDDGKGRGWELYDKIDLSTFPKGPGFHE